MKKGCVRLYTIGIDLGTSAVKLLLVDADGRICSSVTKEYPLSFPKPGWSEQAPEDWWKAVTEGLKELLKDIDASRVKGIGCGGQMHGLVALDENAGSRQVGLVATAIVLGRAPDEGHAQQNKKDQFFHRYLFLFLISFFVKQARNLVEHLRELGHELLVIADVVRFVIQFRSQYHQHGIG